MITLTNKTIAKPKILIVDDEPNAANMMAELLEPLGTCSTAKSYDSALNHINKSSFDLIVTDLFLEGKDGIQLIRKIREIQPGAEVILITGFPATETLNQAHNLGVADYLVKPFAFEKLLDVCDKTLSKMKRKSSNDAPAGFYGIGESRTDRSQKDYLIKILKQCRGNVTNAVKIARISKTGFYRFIKKFNIDPVDFR